MSAAIFDEGDHCLMPGWATYHSAHHGVRRWRLRCWLGRHRLPRREPGAGAAAYDHCPRCKGFLRHYARGEHRFGGGEDIAWGQGASIEPACTP